MCQTWCNNQTEYVSDTEQRSIGAVIKDVQTKPSRKEFVSGTVQSPNDAAMKDVQTMQRKEEYVGDMELTRRAE